MRIQKNVHVLPAIVAAAVLVLSGCSSASTSTAADPSVDAGVDAASVVTVDDPWTKAADSGMTGSFGILENTGEEDITLISAESSLSDSVELHQTSDDGSGAMSMEEKEGGFTIPAGDTLELAPGGNHIMFMDLARPLSAGETVDITLIFSDNSTFEYDAAIRDFAGAEESYEDDDHNEDDANGHDAKTGEDAHGGGDDHRGGDGRGDDRLGGGDKS